MGDSGKTAQRQSFLFVLNPKARQVSDIDSLKHELCQSVGSDDCRFLVPDSPDELATNVQSIFAERPADVLVAVGGDGTVRQLIPLVLQYPDTVLGIVPRGTGNLLAASFGIPQDIRGACEVLHNGHVHRLHLGRINQSYFTLAAGIGIDANIMRNTAPEQKRKIGLLAYFIEGFRQVFSARRMVMDIWVDGQRIRRKGKGMLVINNRNFLTAFNPFQSPTKDNLTDPKLDLCIFNLKNPMEALPALIQLFSQDYANPMLPIEHIRAEKIRLKTKPKVPIQADGDLIGKTPVTIEVLIEKLPVIIPEKLAQEGTGGSLIDTLSQNLEQVLANLLQIAPAQK